MVSIFYKNVSFVNSNGASYIYDVRCNKGDTKPTGGVPNGSECIEMDHQNATCKFYLFDAENSVWCEV